MRGLSIVASGVGVLAETGTGSGVGTFSGTLGSSFVGSIALVSS